MISINKNLIAIFALSAFLFAGCIQQSNTYPVEIFSEMHYNQAQKYQEPPRVPAHPDSVPFNGIGEKSIGESSSWFCHYEVEFRRK